MNRRPVFKILVFISILALCPLPATAADCFDDEEPVTTASPPGGPYTSVQTVSLTCDDGKGCGCDQTYYTTDGSFPTVLSSVYSTPITISKTTTLRFISEDFAGNLEAPNTEIYVINEPEIPPVADAGPDHTVHPPAKAQLDGSRSTDKDGDVPLSYAWTLKSKPPGSGAVLSKPDKVNPTFEVDRLGEYVVTLVVTDSVGFSSDPDEVIISTSNSAPIARAGGPQKVHLGKTVILDGSKSSDPDDDPITYSWELLSNPPGSNARLSDDHTPNPTFTPDVPGDYAIQLVVVDQWGFKSSPDRVTLDTFNTKPIAEAGEDQSVLVVGSDVKLNGKQSRDPDDDPISYEWAMNSKPTGSKAALSNSLSEAPSFVADVHGTYIIQLVVRDQWVASDPDTVTVGFDNIAPVANAGNNLSVQAGEEVHLDGRGSSDANNDPLTFAWSIVNSPVGSTAALVNPDKAQASYVPDLPGTYIVSLVVDDGLLKSAASNVTIEATSSEDAVIDLLKKANAEINGLDPHDFKFKIMKKELTGRINFAIKMVDSGHYRMALAILEHWVLLKMDGCAEDGNPDKGRPWREYDWIVTCEAQDRVHPHIKQAVEELKDLR